MKIYYIGDTHGDIDIGKVQNFEFDENSVIIQLGDFGAIWSDNMKENTPTLDKWVKKLKDKNITLIIVPGNHENYNAIFKLPITKKQGIIEGEFYTLKYDGFEFNFIKNPLLKIKDKEFLCIRGAESIDKYHRKENVTWWAQETLGLSEEQEILKLTEKKDNFYAVLSHTCPSFLIREYLPDNVGFLKLSDPVSRFMDKIVDLIDFELWMFGHFHIDKRYGPYICLYDYIIKDEV